MNHSLDDAVKAGIVTAEAAACGLSTKDMQALYKLMPTVEVLVRYRNGNRSVVRAGEFYNMTPQQYDNIRDVMALAIRC
jgi:hypothetical protein